MLCFLLMISEMNGRTFYDWRYSELFSLSLEKLRRAMENTYM